ncbi:transcription factor AP-4-like isoform X2 [Heptranchias perlo]|uniref:transcription factor AP-4-like isoform X2 n=1 Tax=Heptranchias perlo TaxID=212740 RepID=UPI00355AAAF8
MAYYAGQKTLQEFRKAEKEVIGGLCSLSNIPLTPESQRDHDRRIRREIANSNERRRMQSINAGFQSLKVLLPHTDGEKLSKAAILQQTAEYIFALEEDKTRLMQQNAHLKRLVQEYTGSSPKRKRGDESDEGIGSPDSADEELAELRQQLEKERQMRNTLEEKVRALESQLQPGKLKEILQQAQLQQEHDKVLERRRQLVEEQQRTISTAQAIQHIEATEQGIKEEPEGMEKQASVFLNLDGMQQAIKEEREWHGLVTASPLIIKSSFNDAESESEDADRREMLAARRRPKVEVQPLPSVLVPGSGIL